MGSTIAKFPNPSILRKTGIQALTRELGVVGMAYFLRQFESGEGDYTREREVILSDVTMEEVEQFLERNEIP